MNALRQIVGVAPGLHSGATLADALQAWGVDTLLIAGYMTHNCFDSTAREAFHRGYRVGVVADASATRDLPGPDRRSIPVATVHATVLATGSPRSSMWRLWRRWWWPEQEAGRLVAQSPIE